MSIEPNEDSIVERNMDPELKAGLEQLIGGAPDDPMAMRRQAEQSQAARRSAQAEGNQIEIENRHIPGPDGAPDVPIRIYAPRDRSGILPGFLNIHGGGLVGGDLDMDDEICSRMVKTVGCVVVSVDYRHPPEDPFPASPEDCYAALRWMAASAGELGIDPERIGVGGPSSGGLLAAAVPLMTRDRGEVKLAFQRLMYGGFDNRVTKPSKYTLNHYRSQGNKPDGARNMWSAYLGKGYKGKVSPYAAPARADDLTGLPPAYIMVGGLDATRDQNIQYALRLMRSGVSTELHIFPGAFHAFPRVAPKAQVSVRAVAECDFALKYALNREKADNSDSAIHSIIERNMDPELKTALSQLARISDNPQEARQQSKELTAYRNTTQAKNKRVEIEDRRVPGPAGAPEVPVRIYVPRDRSGVLPGFLNIHGGGLVAGDLDMDDDICCRVVENVGCVVVSVDYRHPPENSFPASPEDCYAALRWMAASAGELGLDPARIGVGGPSAGSLLSAAVALMARDRGEVKLAFQRLLYGGFDNRGRPAKYTINPFVENGTSRRGHSGMWKAYLGKDYKGDVSPYAAPARAKDLSGLPPAYIMVGELDPSRDENIRYAMRLMQAGVKTELHVFPGAYHAFPRFVPDAQISKRAVEEFDLVLKRALYDDVP